MSGRGGDAARTQRQIGERQSSISATSSPNFQQYVDEALSLRERFARAAERGDDPALIEQLRHELDVLLNGEDAV
jgi:hypothetical protein